MTFILQIIIVGLLISILCYLFKIFKLSEQLNKMVLTYRNVRQGLHSAYSIEDVETECFKCRKAWEGFQMIEGEFGITTDWIKDLMATGSNLETIIGEARRHSELEQEYEKSRSRYAFMLRANTDVLRGVKTTDEIYEEEEKMFTGAGSWGYLNMADKLGKYDDWIRENYELLKTSNQVAKSRK